MSKFSKRNIKITLDNEQEVTKNQSISKTEHRNLRGILGHLYMALFSHRGSQGLIYVCNVFLIAAKLKWIFSKQT